jgi:hypothetical protein
VPAGVARAMVYGALRGAVPISDVQLSIVHRCVKEYEYELRVDDEVRHRMAERGLETTIARLRTQLDDISAATDTRLSSSDVGITSPADARGLRFAVAAHPNSREDELPC